MSRSRVSVTTAPPLTTTQSEPPRPPFRVDELLDFDLNPAPQRAQAPRYEARDRASPIKSAIIRWLNEQV